MVIILWLSSSVDEKGIITKYNKETEANQVTSLVDMYEDAGIRFPYVVLAQSVLETDWFQSPIYEHNRNRFGMKFNRRGYTTKKVRGHAYYPSSVASLKDYAAWQKRVLALKVCNSEEDYLDVLDDLPLCKGCRYAEDPNYTYKLRGIMQKLRELESI